MPTFIATRALKASMTVTASMAFMFASALSAVFGIVYLPVLMRQPKAFVSPYAKADVRKRAAAAIADGMLRG